MIVQATLASEALLAETTRTIFAFIKTFIKTWDRSDTRIQLSYMMV